MVIAYLVIVSRFTDEDKKKNPVGETIFFAALIAFPLGGVIVWVFPEVRYFFS